MAGSHQRENIVTRQERSQSRPVQGGPLSLRARAIAFYLPQFHPIPENDEWWGKGFTEWTNVAKAKPLFRGHYQPRVPADLGFYDLRVPETRIAQAELARQHGIEAFCYWHYWFAGRRILDRPFNEVLKGGEPDFPFCIAWANMTWTGIWHGAPDRVLIEQAYPGQRDYEAHFNALLPAFRDRRYVRVDGKPLFCVYKPRDLPNAKAFSDLWRELAHRAGLGGLFLVGEAGWPWIPQDHGFDASVTVALPELGGWAPWWQPLKRLAWYRRRFLKLPTIYRYADVLDQLLEPAPPNVVTYPAVMPNWDNTPRSGANGLVLHDSTPALFREHLRQALTRVESYPWERRLLFIKSWNEWAEGNHLEPDLRFGHGYLEVLRDELALIRGTSS
jgi:lipopolysaccharide biosynthesis protein